MILPRSSDARHKIQMFRLLKGILKDGYLSSSLVFKGGTYAALRGILDRFSIDLDFDLPDKSDKVEMRKALYELFAKLNFEIKDESQNHLQFFLRYEAPEYSRNTLKLEINDVVTRFDRYEKVYLPEVSMYANGQTLATMFAYKLIAAKARYDKNHKISGRDFYDVHKFLLEGLPVNKDVIQEVTGLPFSNYIQVLRSFIRDYVTDKLLREDLNVLLPQAQLEEFLEVARPELDILLSDLGGALGEQ